MPWPHGEVKKRELTGEAGAEQSLLLQASSMASSLSHKRKTKLKDIKAMGQQLLSSKAHINNLPLLIRFVSSEAPPHHLLESLLSLQSFFITVLPELPPSAVSSKRPRLGDSAKEDPESIYRTWLRSKFDELVRSMVEVLSSPDAEEVLREVILDALMDFVKLGNGGQFQSAIYHKLLHSIVYSAAPSDMLSELLASKYFKYIDVRYFTCISMEKFAKTLEADDGSDEKTTSGINETEGQQRESLEISIRKLYNIISRVPPLESSNDKSEVEMWSKSAQAGGNGQPTNGSTNNVLFSASIDKKMRLKFTKAWTAFLRLPLPVDVYKEVLAGLHQAVIPHMSKPVILCDFLTRSYDIGGVVSVMALSSLFILMTQHGLEYPNFYEKLYALLVPSIFLAKHRAKFFQLLDSCLKSPLLPAYLAAAFAKKLSRMALSVPPSGALIIIALIHNLLRRHPSINCLVHQEDDDAKAEPNTEDFVENTHKSITDANASSERPGLDQFNDEESNPVKSNAMRSSLWEIYALRHHYCPPVSRFVLSLENDLTVRSKTAEVNVKDFSSGSYATIFGAEMRRRVKQVPLAFYKATPSSLFSECDFPGWTFKYEESKESNTEISKHINPDRPEMKDVSEKRQRIECS